MKEIQVGLRFSEETGIDFFGLDDINLQINLGKKIVCIKEGNILMTKEELEEDVQLTLKGFSLLITVED